MKTYWKALMALIAVLAAGCSPSSIEKLAKRPFQAAEVLAFGPPPEKERVVVVPVATPEKERIVVVPVVPPAPVQPVAPAAPSPPPELAAGMRAFRECGYEAAIQLFDEAAADPECARSDRARAYLYGGACCYYAGREEGAAARFRLALRAAPDLAPSREDFTPELVNFFETVRREAK